MFGFLRKLIDYFRAPVAQLDTRDTEISKNNEVKPVLDLQRSQGQELEVSLPPKMVVGDVEKRVKKEPVEGMREKTQKQTHLQKGLFTKSFTSREPVFEPLKMPIQTVKTHRFARLDESDTHDKFLLPATKYVSGRTISLKEIPFEATRDELLQMYLVSLENCLRSDKLKTLTPYALAGHYLLIKSLIAATTEKGRLLTLEKLFSGYLKNKGLNLGSMINGYMQDSEFPIVQWLKNQHQSANSNFIDSLIIEMNKGLLSRNQSAFIKQFKDSPAFFFPDSIYMAWLAHGYEPDSRVNPMYNISNKTHYYHAMITDNLLLRTQPKHITFAPKHYYEQGKRPVNTDFRYMMNSDKLLRIQGRTLLFSDKSGELIAVKVQKKGESKASLTEEYQMADYLQKHRRRLDLQSDLPKPLGQYTLDRTAILEKCSSSSNYKQFLALIDDSSELDVYVYQAPLAYFTYLHDEQQSLKEFTGAVQRNVHDLFVLLREGIVFSQLADIFHTHSDLENRTDKGRYQALVQLLNVFQTQLGRIDKWKKSVEFVNLRASGLADLGDSLPITDLLTSSSFAKKYFSELLTGGYHQTFFDPLTESANSLFTGKRKLFGNYLYLNTIAEYLLVLQLVIGSYGDKVTRHIDNLVVKHQIWQQLAELMFSSCAETIALMTGIPHQRALALLNQRAKIDNHVQQTEFWMTPDYAKLESSQMKMQQYVLYAGEAGYEVNDKLVSGIGLTVDGKNQDLGGYNQELPLRELEKLVYATVTLIEGTMQLDKAFFNQIEETEQFIADSDAAEGCYQAAAKLLDMARPGCLLQKRLALSYYNEVKLKYPSVEASKDIGARFEKVERHAAAQTIQRFWRDSRKPILSLESTASNEDSIVRSF